MKRNDDCIFCKIVAGEIPAAKVYEDDRALAIMDIMPLNRGHLLVIPKDHYGNILEIDPDLYGYLCGVISKISRALHAAMSPDGMTVLQLNGKASDQIVPHLHVHLVPRWTGDGVTISAWEPVMGNKEEIAVAAAAIKAKL